TLDFSKTIIDEVLQGDFNEQTQARTILGSLNITKDKVSQNIGSLSIGERSKVALAKIVLSDVNVLILDEPTNHLEITAREAIEDAFERFMGTIIFVSHDRYFLEKLATHQFCLDGPRGIES
ncbi:ATP-binding cassette domain-containing protein, partial [candidate division CSSED10-310 bacterium]